MKVRDLLGLALAGLLAAVLLTGYSTIRIWQQGQQDERRPADAIVVLGAAQYDGTPSPVLRARLDHAIDLYRAGVAPAFVVTGGKGPNDRVTEAGAARAYVTRRGVPEAAILDENQGVNTVDSLAGAAVLLRARGMRTAVFVSDRSHMLRVLRIALDQGIDAWGSPTTTSPADATFARRTRAIIHELGGLALYFVGGRAPGDDADLPDDDVDTPGS